MSCLIYRSLVYCPIYWARPLSFSSPILCFRECFLVLFGMFFVSVLRPMAIVCLVEVTREKTNINEARRARRGFEDVFLVCMWRVCPKVVLSVPEGLHMRDNPRAKTVPLVCRLELHARLAERVPHAVEYRISCCVIISFYFDSG